MEIQQNIQKIKDIFKQHSIEGSREAILASLDQFEDEVSAYADGNCLSVIINWYKNIFLQKTGCFARAEELLDEGLSFLEQTTSPIGDQWKLKIYLSLGYVHRARWNYTDAEAYLIQALAISELDPSLTRYRGELFSLLSKVNFDLGRYDKARKYVDLEKKESAGNFHVDPENRESAIIFAYSLKNFCKINRHIGWVDTDIELLLNQSIQLFNDFDYPKGVVKARLELTAFEFTRYPSRKMLETVCQLENECRHLQMNKDIMRVQILKARIHKKIEDYTQAENILHDLIRFSREQKFQHSKMTAEVFYELGSICHETHREDEAFEAFTESAKIGMIIGLKDIILRSSNAISMINRNNPEKKLISDLIYQNTLFIKDRFQRNRNPLTVERTTERFFATTMFVDIVGFSHLMLKSSENLTVRMIDELINRMCLIIYKNSGYIDKFLGDGFMAIFEHGSTLSADLAFKAVLSGIDIHRALKHKNRSIKAFYGVKEDVNVRIGISTGEIHAVFLGSYIKREFTYMGNSVNLASKLEQNAANRLMLIDKATCQLTRKRIHASKEQIHIHGLGDIIAYHVRSLKRRHNRRKKMLSGTFQNKQGDEMMNLKPDEQNTANFRNAFPDAQTAFEVVKNQLFEFEICENRQITQDYCELVLSNTEKDSWYSCLSEQLGVPVKSAGEQTTDEFLALTHDFGEIVDHQTLFMKTFDDISIIAMLWPWQDHQHTTVILTIFNDHRKS